MILFFIAKKNWFRFVPILTIAVIAGEILIRWLIWHKHRPDIAYSADVNQGYEIYFKNLFYPTYTRLDGLAIGSFLAYLKHFKGDRWNQMMAKTHHIFSLALLILLPTFYLIYNKTQFFNSVLGYSAISLGMACLVVSSLSDKSILQKIKIPGITFISILSYSIYLTHGHALDLSSYIGRYFNFSPYGILQILLQIFMILSIASILYWGLEKPILKQRDRILKKI